MNLTNVGTLARRIRALLRHQEPESQGPQLAQDFAAVCQSVVQRLTQCESMLSQGNEHQALQQAESPPPLMDLLTRVGFREFAQWRAYCQARQYAVPPLIDAGVVRRLNAAYAQGIGPDHPLYAEYRGAILVGDDDKALAALRLIVQLNPSDQQMRKELEQRELSVLRSKLEELEEALRTGDPGAVLRQLEEIEAMNLPNRPTGEVWKEGQYVRIKLKIETLPAHREVQDWGATARLCEEVKALCAEHGIELKSEDAPVVQEAETWAEEERRAYEEEQLHQRTLGELEHLIDQCEQTQLSLRESSQRTLTAQAEALRRKWRELERMNRPVPEGLEERLDKSLQLLEIEIRVKARHRTNLIIASSVGLVVVGLIVGMWLIRQRTVHDVSAELEAAINKAQMQTVSNLLASLTRRAGLTNSPALRQAIQKAHAWQTQELERATVCEQDLTDLTQRFSELTGAGSLSDDQWRSWQQTINDATQKVDGVVPDLRKALKARLDKVAADWDKLVGENRRLRNEAFKKRMASARETRRALEYTNSVPGVTKVLTALGPLLDELRAATNAPLPQLAIEPESVLELDGLTARCAAFSAEVGNWHQITNALAGAPTIEAYLEALRAFVKCEFSPSGQRPLATAVADAKVAVEEIQKSLLFPSDVEAWTEFQKSRKLTLWPEDKPSAEEEKKITALSTDPNIHHAFLIDFRGGGIGHSRRIYGRNTAKDGFDIDKDAVTHTDKAVFTFSAEVYDPEQSPRVVVFRPRKLKVEVPMDADGKHRDAEFPWDHQSTLPRETAGSGSDRKFEPLPERMVYSTSGLAGLCNDTGAYGTSLLGIADKVLQGTNCPVFRAFLLLRIAEIGDERRLSWGLQWTPALGVHRTRIQQIVQGDLESGDWMLPDKNQRLDGPLVRFFEEARPMSYLKQARFFQRLAEATMDAGMAFVGHVDADGRSLRLLSPDMKQDLWGLDADKRSSVRLVHWSSADQAYRTITVAAPFTPLYALKTKPQILIQAAEQSTYVKADDPSIKPWLNPLFTDK